MARMIRILVVDDSLLDRQKLCQVIRQAPDMHIVGETNDGKLAVILTSELRPDVILMKAMLPAMTGLDATREIMRRTPTPIVLLTADLEATDSPLTFEALTAGALATVQKPGGANHTDLETMLLATLRAMADVRVIHHRRLPKVTIHGVRPTAHNNRPHATPQIVGIVSSTGGPAALVEIVQRLPEHFPLPIVIVQHIAPNFVPSLQMLLANATPLHVTIAEVNATPRSGHIYLAPGNAHLVIDSQERFRLRPDRSGEPHMPSGDIFLSAISQVYQASAVGIVLTGMGRDGAQGLRKMYDAGAYTIAQNETSCAVYGMPREAVELGAAEQVLHLHDIPDYLIALTRLGASDESKTTYLNR